jgi:Quinohemoprotein amine dehydrogenase, alpha subunit domain III
VPANALSRFPSVSTDGRYVSFESSASDLVAGDTNGLLDVFRRDLLTGTTTRVNVEDVPLGDRFPALGSAISGDGRFVSYWAPVPNERGSGRVFLRDFASGRTTLASADPWGQPPLHDAFVDSTFSGDGRYIAIVSDDDLVELQGSSEGADNVYVRFTAQPDVTSVAPSSVARGATQTVTMNGAGFLGGLTVAVNGEGVTVTSTTVVSATQLQVTLTVAPDAATGVRNITLNNVGTGPGPDKGSFGGCTSCLTIT